MSATTTTANASPVDASVVLDHVAVSNASLENVNASSLVADDRAGAISTFIGVTRNTFQGKEVLKLEYEAYEAMAVKQLKTLCSEMRAKWPSITRTAILHRTGEVLVGEASVIIAVSSPHRRESLESVAWCIDELKARVVIWKKEFYTDGSTWKENAEWREEQARIKAKQQTSSPK